jgi:hypothetical protein
MPDFKGIITAHFIAHWGVPTAIYPQGETSPELAILEFAPRTERNSWRYVTNGMSSCIQVNDLRTEIYACSRRHLTWIHGLLAAIAEYPTDYNTCIAEGDTIAVGQPVDRNTSPFTGVLFVAPDPIDSPTVGLVGGVPEKILVHRVVGLLPSELKFAEGHGGKELCVRLAHGEEPLIDEKRAPVV